MEVELKLSVKQIQEMRHAIGNNVDKPYRNHFCTGTNCPSWEELVTLGLATKENMGALGGIFYYVTDKGKILLKRILKG
jgi:hypothetical protein